VCSWQRRQEGSAAWIWLRTTKTHYFRDPLFLFQLPELLSEAMPVFSDDD